MRRLAFLAMRPMTLGVRAAAFDGNGDVFLVRHTYLSGWYMPGGGVEAGETVEDSLVRELREEGNLEVLEPPRLASVHFNRAALGRDHVLIYVCPRVRQTAPKTPNYEIADSGFFSLGALPETTTPGTRRRLAEIAGETPPDPYW